MLKLKLHWQILIAMILGILLGLYYQNIDNGPIYQVIISLGTIFVRLLKMIIVPLIFTSCSIFKPKPDDTATKDLELIYKSQRVKKPSLSATTNEIN